MKLLIAVCLFIAISKVSCKKKRTYEEDFMGGCGWSDLPPPHQSRQDPTFTRQPTFAAKSSEVPWQARILVDGKFKCSAAVVSSVGVTTSALCIDEALGLSKNGGGAQALSRVRIIVGAAFDYRAERFGGAVFGVKRIYTHGNYINDPNKNINDLAYINLDKTIAMPPSDKVGSLRPVCVVRRGDADAGKPGHVAVISYWLHKKSNTRGPGSFSYTGCDTTSSSTQLPHKTWLRIVPTDQCMHYFPVNRRLWPADHYVCAQADMKALNASICCAEKGAPLVQKLGNRWYLIGVFSQISGCQYNPKGTPPTLLFAATTGTQVSWMRRHSPDEEEESPFPLKGEQKMVIASRSATFSTTSRLLNCIFAVVALLNRVL